MPRILFTKRKALLLVLILLAVASLGWRSARGPREPVLKGKSLSWWFTEGIDAQNSPVVQRLTADELRGLGPKAVEWLACQASRTSIWDMEEPPSSARFTTRYLWWMRTHWFDGPASRAARIRFEAVVALGELEPEAAPVAIPALLKAMRCEDSDTRLVAADLLLGMGSVSWPAVSDALRHADARTQGILIYKLDVQWPPNAQSAISPEKFAEMVDLLVPMTLHRDQWLRDTTMRKFEECLAAWKAQPKSAEGVRLASEILARRKEAETDDFISVQILGALAILEPGNPRWPAALSEKAASSNKELADAAERALIHAGK